VRAQVTLRQFLSLALCGALLCVLVVPWHAGGQESAPKAKGYKRNVKRLGSSKGHLVGNRKGLKKGKYPLSSRSFSSKEYQERSSSKLREMHKQAFQNRQTAVEALEGEPVEGEANDEDWKPENAPAGVQEEVPAAK